jgi:hypothetical protein
MLQDSDHAAADPTENVNGNIRIYGGSNVRRQGVKCAALLVSAIVVSVWNVPEIQAQGWLDRFMDRAADSAQRKAEDRVNRRVDQSIDGAIDKTEQTVKCVATDQECLKRANSEGKNVVLTDSTGAADTMRCTASDTDCLKTAKQLRKKVEIVDEAELAGYTLRCAATDAACLNRAKAEGKKVEITD